MVSTSTTRRYLILTTIAATALALGSSTPKSTIVEAVSSAKASATAVYNLSVAERHNYLVGHHSVLVHNCNIPIVSLGPNLSSRPGRIFAGTAPNGREAVFIRTPIDDAVNSPQRLSQILSDYRARGGDLFPENLGLVQDAQGNVFLAVERLGGTTLQTDRVNFTKWFDTEAVPQIAGRLGISEKQASNLIDYAFRQPDKSVRLRFDQLRNENLRLYLDLHQSGR